MNAPNIKRQIPDRAVVCIIFGWLSLYTFRVYAELMWGPAGPALGGHWSDQALDAIGSTCERLETGRKVLAIVALIWCVWSWCKEWWVPALVATLFTALVLFTAFCADT
jgi:hypothetical protein